jgi:molybdopterin-guanine dinucleotide biosynthesis protein A
VAGDFDAVVLAGGAGTRMRGLLKPVIAVAGVRMVDRVVEAVGRATRVVVVGPAELGVERPAADGRPVVVRVQEEPAGGGPVAAVEAAVRLGGLASGIVVIVGGDLPLLNSGHVRGLVGTVVRFADAQTAGAVYIDGDGRAQWLCSAWRTEAVRDRLAGLAAARHGRVAGAALRDLFGPLEAVQVRVRTIRGDREDLDELPPWFDCDTDEDLRRAEEWLAE